MMDVNITYHITTVIHITVTLLVPYCSRAADPFDKLRDLFSSSIAHNRWLSLQQVTELVEVTGNQLCGYPL